jgi:hypothetical protein
VLGWIRNRRRAKVRGRPFPREWASIVETNVPYYALLPEPDRRELIGHVQVFLDEKRFEGCGGMVVTDGVRVTVAAQACILLLHRKTDYYPLLQTVLVYPGEYGAPMTRAHGSYVEEEGIDVRSGESWDRGAVVLSWEDVLHGPELYAGENVVLHEFAHQLDDEAGPPEGTPKLPDRKMHAAWAEVLGREYEALGKADDAGTDTLIDPYGAEDPSEFFAVVTECFFEDPLNLRDLHPELYEQFRLFYRQDPADLMERAPE